MRLRRIPDAPPGPTSRSVDDGSLTHPNGAEAGVWAGSNGHGLFEPPNSHLATAIGRHKLLVCICALLCAAGGIAFGFSRDPAYTASATLQVGQVNPNSPGFASYTQSTTALATAFSRSIDAAPVLSGVERKLGLPANSAVSRLSAEPIPLSPVFRVIATGSSAKAATNLANAAATAVIGYVGKTNSTNPEARSLLREYTSANVALRRAKAKVEALEGKESASSRKLLEAEAAASGAQVQVEALNRSYIGAITSQAPREGLLTLVAGATSASSDSHSKVELYGLLGLLVGLVVGCGLAVVREPRLIRGGVEAHPAQP